MHFDPVETFRRELKMGGRWKFETRRQKLETRNWKSKEERDSSHP
jgi:hypothetical protein